MYAINWYHMYIINQGMDFTEANSSQHYYWTNIRDKIWYCIKFYNNFPKNKKNKIWSFTCKVSGCHTLGQIISIYYRPI